MSDPVFLEANNVKCFAGALAHCIELSEVEVIPYGVLVVCVETGKIEAVLNSLHHQSTIDRLKLISEGSAPASDEWANKTVTWQEHGKNSFMIPGFVDAHFHAPQYEFSGIGMDCELLQWLEKYTFPCEHKYRDVEYARKWYERVVQRTLRNGTTFVSYFATIHKESSLILAKLAADHGQRAYVGKVSMDQRGGRIVNEHGITENYEETTDDAIKNAREFCMEVLKMTPQGTKFLDEATPLVEDETNPRPSLLNRNDTPLVLPVVTPRFVPTCSSQLMLALGNLSYEFGLPVQSHLSENLGEIDLVREDFPDMENYAGVYKKFGLLNSRSYMAHCCYCGTSERNTLKSNECGVVHCASSNFMLSSGVMNARKYLQEGHKVSLGTDVAGGYSSSILDAMRQSMVASHVCGFQNLVGMKRSEKERMSALRLSPVRKGPMFTRENDVVHQSNEIQHFEGLSRNWSTGSLGDSEFLSPTITAVKTEYNVLTTWEVLYLATLGGAKVLNMDKVVGNFVVGKQLDCLLVNLDVKDTPVDVPDDASLENQLEKFIYLGDDRNITHVYVNGNLVHQRNL